MTSPGFIGDATDPVRGHGIDADIAETMELSGKLAEALHRMCYRYGPSDAADYDWNEMAIVIHDIQARVLAQVAARAFPGLYRPLGTTIR